MKRLLLVVLVLLALVAMPALSQNKIAPAVPRPKIYGVAHIGLRTDNMKRAIAKQTEAEREKQTKIIAAEGEALAAGELANASDIMMAHPLALQLRNLQTLIEISVEKNSTIVFPAPLMSTIQELGAFLRHETEGAQRSADAPPAGAVANGADVPLAGIAASWEPVP